MSDLEARVTALEVTMSGVLITQSGQAAAIASLQASGVAASGSVHDLEHRVQELEKGAGITPSSWQVTLSLEPVKADVSHNTADIVALWEEIHKIEPILAAHGIAIKQLQPTGA